MVRKEVAEAKTGDKPHCSVSQRVKLQVRIPLTFVRSHLPSLQLLTPGLSAEVPVQLVLLPPGAADLTTVTPAVAVIGIEQGVKVSLYQSDSGKKETKRYTVHGLSNALPKSEDWWCRGFRKLNDTGLQILFSSALDSDEKVAKDSLVTRNTQTRKSAQQAQASQAVSPSTSTQQEHPQQLQQQQQPSQASDLTAAAASRKAKPPRYKKQQPQNSQQTQDMQAAEPTAAQLVSQIMQELDAEPAAQQPATQLSGMKRPAEGQPPAEERSVAASMHAESQAGPGTPASGLVGVPIKPSDPRKRLLMHAGGLERRISVETSASSTAQPEQQRQQQAQQQQQPPQQQPKEEPQQQVRAQREAVADQQEQQQQADAHAGKSQVQQDGERAGPRPIPPPCPPPGGPPPPSKSGRGRPGQQHRAPPPPGMRPPPAGGWGPHDMPPLHEVDPWEAQQYWEGGPGLEGGPGSRGPHMQQHWDGRGQQPPPPGYWDGPGPPPRHHDQFQKHGDRRPFPPDPKWAQGDRRKEPFGDPRGMDFQAGSSRDREFERVRGGGRGGGFNHGRGGGRGGRGFDPREGEQRGYRDQFGPLPYPPEGLQEPSYRHERGRDRGRGSDRGSGDMRRPDEHPAGFDQGWGPEPGWGNDRGWEDDPLRGPTGVIRRSGDRRMPPGRGMDSRGRLPGPPGSERRSLSPERGPGLSRGPGFRGHPGEPHPAVPRPDGRGPGREHSSERSRERSAPRGREGRSPDRSMGSDRRGAEGASPRRQRSPGSPHSDRRRGSSPQRQRSSADGAPAAMVVPGAKQAYAAAIAAKRSSSVTPAGSSGTDGGANAGAAKRSDRGDRGAQGKGAQEAADNAADQQPAPALCALIWQQQSGIRLPLKDLQACVPSLKPRRDAADLQLLFVEEQHGQNVVVAGPVTVQATLSADGRVGFLGEELKPVQELLHGSVIVNMYPSEPNPDRPKGADSGGWPDALIVTVKQSGKAGASAQGSREPQVLQQQQLPAASTPAVQQGWVQQEQPGIVPQQQQQQVVWQQQQHVVGQQDQQHWVNASTGPPSSDGGYVYQQVQHVHVTPDGQYILQQPTTVLVTAQGMQAMNTAVQGLHTVSTHAGVGQAGMLPVGTGMTQPAAPAAGYGVGTQPGQDLQGMQGPAAAAHLLPATASVTSAHGATALEEQHLAAALAAAGQAAVGQPAGALDPHAGLNGQHAGSSPVTSTGGGAPPVAAAAHAGAASSDEAAGAAPAPASALPALPAVTGGTAAMTDEVMDAVVELVTLLNKDHDPSLDIGCCAEVLYDMQEDPAAAKKFMRVVYTALCSAVRLNNPAGAVSVIKRYLQKA